MNAEEVDMRRTVMIRWVPDGLSTGQRQNSAALIRNGWATIWNGTDEQSEDSSRNGEAWIRGGMAEIGGEQV